MRGQKIFALKREIITIIDGIEEIDEKLLEEGKKNEIVLKLKSFLNKFDYEFYKKGIIKKNEILNPFLDKADFEGCEEGMRKSNISTRCSYYYELMGRGDNYSGNL